MLVAEKSPLFRQFAKKSETIKRPTTANAIIYTRVSTKEQADNNMSLKTQLKACEDYTRKMQLNVVGYFGGTYESAQTDERKEFKRMLDFAKKSKEKVSYIIVYSVDRFSRTGANGMYIASLLREQGIVIQAVTQQTDVTTPGGQFQQNMYFVFSQYDNDLRREKCTAGTREKLMQGYWVTKPPIGYDIVRRNEEKFIVVNETGKLIRKAFLWKAQGGLSSEEILKRLAKLGLKLTNKRISVIFRNPFYCGLIAHSLLNGELVEGKQEKLISKEIFLETNSVLKSKRKVFKKDLQGEAVPLKRFMKCDNCGSYLRGYIVQRKGIHYYKCPNGSCSCNQNAGQLHRMFEQVLDFFTIKEAYIPALKEILADTYEQMNQGREEERELAEGRLGEINRKMERLEERYLDEEIDRAFFEKYSLKLKEERNQIEEELEKTPVKKSNLAKYIDISLATSCKLSSLWKEGSFEMKQKVQFLLFPEGIYFNKKKGESRTSKVNSVFSAIGSISANYIQKAKGEFTFPSNFPLSVVPTGIEPVSKV